MSVTSNELDLFDRKKHQTTSWLSGERSMAYTKFSRRKNIHSIIKSEQFDSKTLWGINLRQYAHRSEIMYNGIGETTPQSRQLLAKHMATVSFLLLDYEAIRNEKFDEDAKIRENFESGLVVVGDTGHNPSYQELKHDNDYIQSDEVKEAFDINDRDTWQPWIKNLGLAGHMLLEQMDSGPLPYAGVSAGDGIDNLMPDTFSANRAF